MTGHHLSETNSPSPLHPALLEGKRMNVDIAVNAEGRVWILHDQALAGVVSWVEYDPDDHSLHLIMRDGSMEPLGASIRKELRPYFGKRHEINIVYTKETKIVDFFRVPLIVRQQSAR